MLKMFWKGVYGVFRRVSADKISENNTLFITRTNNNLMINLYVCNKGTKYYNSIGSIGVKRGVKSLNEFEEQIKLSIKLLKNKIVTDSEIILQVCGLSATEVQLLITIIQGTGLSISKIIEHTPINHNGGKTKKIRRL